MTLKQFWFCLFYYFFIKIIHLFSFINYKNNKNNIKNYIKNIINNNIYLNYYLTVVQLYADMSYNCDYNESGLIKAVIDLLIK